MNKKQKKMLARIIIAAVLLIVLHFVPITGIPRFIMFIGDSSNYFISEEMKELVNSKDWELSRLKVTTKFFNESIFSFRLQPRFGISRKRTNFTWRQ